MSLQDSDWATHLYELLARGGDDEQMFLATIAGDPWSKSRPRFARGKAYKPRDDKSAEDALKWNLIARKAPMFHGNVMVACRFYRSNLQRIDADNLLKHVCDSANGILWKDDSQVTLVIGEMHLDANNPRTVIMAGNHESTLLRGTDNRRNCAHCKETFIPNAGRKEHRFCSTRCAYAARVTALQPRTCAHCGISFQPPTKKQAFCSRKCGYDSLKGKPRNGNGPNSRCSECAKELSHRRGGRCRDCWVNSPGFYPRAVSA